MRRRRGRRRRGDGCAAHTLSSADEGQTCVVTRNHDVQSVEMGLCQGANVSVLKKAPGDSNMVIAVGDSRYVITKETAERILVR